MNRIQRFLYQRLHPEIYQGHRQSPPYFEGWYFKIVSADAKHRFAIIPGVFLGEDGHAFVQVLDGANHSSAFHRYPLENFQASEGEFDIFIGPNYFSELVIRLNIDDELGSLSGTLRFVDVKPWPVTLFSPGIMGWYAWVPGMETYHGVLSLDHGIEGNLTIDGETVDFTGGRGYIEKDWGQAFPSAYVWMQTNHFDEGGTSLSASIAMIPWVRRSFRGFIVGFLHHGKLYRFATYTGATTELLEVTDDSVVWVMEDKRYQLKIEASRYRGGLIHGPTRKEMIQRVEETMTAEVMVTLSTREGDVIYQGSGQNAALEVFGDLPTLLSEK